VSTRHVPVPGATYVPRGVTLSNVPTRASASIRTYMPAFHSLPPPVATMSSDVPASVTAAGLTSLPAVAELTLALYDPPAASATLPFSSIRGVQAGCMSSYCASYCLIKCSCHAMRESCRGVHHVWSGAGHHWRSRSGIRPDSEQEEVLT